MMAHQLTMARSKFSRVVCGLDGEGCSRPYSTAPKAPTATTVCDSLAHRRRSKPTIRLNMTAVKRHRGALTDLHLLQHARHEEPDQESNMSFCHTSAAGLQFSCVTDCQTITLEEGATAKAGRVREHCANCCCDRCCPIPPRPPEGRLGIRLKGCCAKLIMMPMPLLAEAVYETIFSPKPLRCRESAIKQVVPCLKKGEFATTPAVRKGSMMYVTCPCCRSISQSYISSAILEGSREGTF